MAQSKKATATAKAAGSEPAVETPKVEAAPKPAVRGPELIKVRSTDGRAFWERNRDHPGGEVFVAGDAVVKVARTSNVKSAMREGRIEEVPSTGSGQAR